MSGCELSETPAQLNAESTTVALAESIGTVDFPLAFARLQEAAGVCTMQALADLFRVRMSFVSEVKLCEKIPATWMYHLMLSRRVSPEWILFGTGPKKLALVDMVDESIIELLLRTASE